MTIGWKLRKIISLYLILTWKVYTEMLKEFLFIINKNGSYQSIFSFFNKEK